MSNDDEKLYFNGINAGTGTYDLPSLTGRELADLIAGTAPPENLNELRFRYRMGREAHFGVKEGVDPTNLAEAGWGVVFPAQGDPAVQEALSELIALRRSQAGAYFKIYAGPDGYRPGESKAKWLARHGAGPGPADPERVPYYLLLVGDPETIPYRFQSQLDVQYAVGRIHFDDLDAYAAYARSVALAESGTVALPRKMSFFGVANEDDPATNLSADLLVTPLFNKLQEFSREEKNGWELDAVMRGRATRSNLERLLGGSETPALLFTASHGVAFDQTDPRQIPHQGALLCQDWPGPTAWRNKPLQERHYFAGDHLSADANLLGMIGFFFACYGGGTPRYDEFAKQAFKDREEVAPHPFLARLPQKMLAQPRGGALAVIGHVERTWSYSFKWPRAGAQTTVFESTLQRLLKGHPVGSAIEYFNERYAELSTVLADELEEIEFGKQSDPYELSGMWTANNDARGYAIIGDPAVRLPVAEADGAVRDRPVITLQPKNPEPRDVAAPVPFSTTSHPAPAAEEEPGGPRIITEADGARLVTTFRANGDILTRLEEGSLTPELVALHDAALRYALD